MSDVKTHFTPRYRKVETAMDLLDPAQHFQGEAPSEKEQEELVRAAEADEQKKIEDERLEAEQKKLKATRELRKKRAGRTGRRATMVTGPMGLPAGGEVRRATLGAA